MGNRAMTVKARGPRARGGLLAFAASAGRYRETAQEALGMVGGANVAGVAVGGVDGPVDEPHAVTVEFAALLVPQAEQTIQPAQEVQLQRRVTGLILR